MWLPAFTLPPFTTVAPFTVKSPPAVTAFANVTVLAVSVLLPLKFTGLAKPKVKPLPLRLPFTVVVAVPLSKLVLASKVVVCPA